MRRILMTAVMVSAAAAGQVRITIGDRSRLPRDVSVRAFDDLRRILSGSGIEAQVVAAVPDAGKSSPVANLDLRRRAEDPENTCRSFREIGLEILPAAPPGLKRGALGMAQPVASGGWIVKVFDDRIRDAAERENRRHAVILAHVMAHEIGHVLLSAKAHPSAWGLMSSVWTKFEYVQMARGLMFYTREQSRAMRMNLAKTACNEPQKSDTAGKAD